MENSKIEWTHHTFNPWWGCIKVSAECTNCYAETLSKRWGFKVFGHAKTTGRRGMGDSYWRAPVNWDEQAKREGVRKRVFCSSMADVFEENADLNDERKRLWTLILKTPNLDWLLLTKRPENILKMIPSEWNVSPPANIWLGTSVGINASIWRIAELKKARHIAQVLFLSCEPLLEELKILEDISEGIDWVIAGGESGRNKRPINAAWARVIRNDCEVAGVAFFMKQMDKVQRIPEDLMIREFPNVLTA